MIVSGKLATLVEETEKIDKECGINLLSLDEKEQAELLVIEMAYQRDEIFKDYIRAAFYMYMEVFTKKGRAGLIELMEGMSVIALKSNS